MILKGFKEKSNKKYINKTVSERVVVTSKSKVQHVGILVNNNEPVDYKWFNTIKDVLNITNNAIEVIAFTNDKKKDESNALISTYDVSDLGWNGTIKDTKLKTFINTNFDLLISYYTDNNTPLKLLTTASKAKFKVGILQEDERINDLIIKTELNDFKTFKIELEKYLKILNKL
ncbi:DUF6913 domain-containing protein [Pontimicrobium sp. MEBiC06410]